MSKLLCFVHGLVLRKQWKYFERNKFHKTVQGPCKALPESFYGSLIEEVVHSIGLFRRFWKNKQRNKCFTLYIFNKALSILIIEHSLMCITYTSAWLVVCTCHSSLIIMTPLNDLQVLVLWQSFHVSCEGVS